MYNRFILIIIPQISKQQTFLVPERVWEGWEMESVGYG